MADTSPRWALPLLHAGQAQKELHHNEALMLIDALLHGRAQSAGGDAPPTDPQAGQCWIVGDQPQGAWAGQAGSLACWTPGGWRFVTPRAGLSIQVADRGHALIHDGAQWMATPVRDEGVYIGGDRVVGARQQAIAAPSGGANIDVEARSILAEILTTMRTHGLISS